MAGIILHPEYVEYLNMLSREEKGALLEMLSDFMTGREPTAETSVAVQIVYKVITERAGREMEKHEAITKRNRENGAKGGRPKKPPTENPEKPSETQNNPDDTQTEPKKAIPIPKPIPIPSKRENITKEKAPSGAARFKPPTLGEVEAYCKERGNSISPQGFINYYDSNGWKVGKNPMKDWRAAVRTWETRDQKTVDKPKNGFHNFEQRKIDYDAILRKEMEDAARAEGLL